MNKELHSEYGVVHKRFENAIYSIIGSVLIIATGGALWYFTGWGWIGIGALVSLLFAVPSIINSFGEEQRETQERECGTQ